MKLKLCVKIKFFSVIMHTCIARKGCPWNELYCVGWDVKPYLFTHSLPASFRLLWDMVYFKVDCMRWFLSEQVWQADRSVSDSPGRSVLPAVDSSAPIHPFRGHPSRWGQPCWWHVAPGTDSEEGTPCAHTTVEERTVHANAGGSGFQGFSICYLFSLCSRTVVIHCVDTGA